MAAKSEVSKTYMSNTENVYKVLTVPVSATGSCCMQGQTYSMLADIHLPTL